MATTTTNFGWDIPQSTDLVKDGATAIAALGQDIDTAFVDLKGGTTGQVLSKTSSTDLDFTWVAQDDSNAIQNAIVDAKGDLIAATAADTPARLAVGTNGQVLTADSTASTGIKWATPATGGMTLLHTVAMTGGSTVTQSGISGSYKHLLCVFNNVSAGGGDDFNLRFNSDTGSNYRWWNQWAYTSFGNNGPAVGSAIGLSIRTPSSNAWDYALGGQMWIYDYTRTTGASGEAWLNGKDGSGNLIMNRTQFTYNTNGSAISSISFIAPSTLDQGNVYIYGVN
jgi:hypothetical protein